MVEIIPTNTCPPDLAELSRRSLMFAQFSTSVQLDVDDGVFAPEISWPYQEGQWAELETMASKNETLPSAGILSYEAHLMVEDPLRIGELLARTGCARLIPHVEAFPDERSVKDAFAIWKNAGASEAGLAVLIETPLSTLDALIPLCDVVQLMSIAELGRQGAAFDARILPRIEELHGRYPGLAIAVDGGVSEKNIADLVRAGARRFGVGSAIMKDADPKAAYERLKALAESALR